jgi:NAD(P)-dependent dehydrogenase (short-subunit alcohol dehydrogenase family)
VRACAGEIAARHDVRAIGIAADVSRADDVARVVAEVETEFGAADIVINNAGTGSNETIMAAPDEKWQQYWDLHVMAAVRLSRGLVPLLRLRGGGVIVNNASICARQPLDYEPIYNVTKAALMMFSKCLANELIKENIRVNCVNPGLVLTPDWKKTATQLTAGTDTTWEAYLDQIAKKNAPIGRFASPEEMAKFFVFLCSPCASYCVGATYQVDGGWLGTVG